jgi:Flp pilus assembly protein TadD
MSAQADEGGVSPPAPTAVARRAVPRRPDERCCRWLLAGGGLGLALLGACASDPAPDSLLVGGRLSAAITELAGAELKASFRFAPTLASVAAAPNALPPPVPVLRARPAAVLPPLPSPPKPATPDRIAWIPQPKPERGPPPERIAWIPQLKPDRPAPEPSAGLRPAIWPPPWKPDPADLPLAVASAAGSLEDPRIATWPPPWKPDPPDLPFAVTPAAGPPEDPRTAIWPAPRKPALADLPLAVASAAGLPEDPRPDGPVRVVVAHGHPERPAVDDGIAVSELDQLLPQLDRAAREALLAGDPATALAIYDRLAARFPEERTAWLGRALALERLGRGGEAQALYQAMLGADPEDLGVKIALLGIVAERAPDEALRLLRRLAHHHPDDARLRAQIAAVLARQGALPAALSEQRRAVALAPANLGYRVNLAILHDRAGAIDAAVEHYRSALELATLGGAPTAQLDAIAARLHHLRARQRPTAPSAPR